jgi:hypothetical protein
MKPKNAILLLLAAMLAGCVSDKQPLSSDDKAVMRALPTLQIEAKIQDTVRNSRAWEMPQFRVYRQEDIDGDCIDDTVVLTTFEHGNTWHRELFVCLSSAPSVVMHMNMGGKGERMADGIELKDRQIIIRGKTYGASDPMSSPSVPYKEVYCVENGRLIRQLEAE